VDDDQGETVTFYFPAGFPREKHFWKSLKNRGEWILQHIRTDMRDDPDVLAVELQAKQMELDNIQKRLEQARVRAVKTSAKTAAPPSELKSNFINQIAYQVQQQNWKYLKEMKGIAMSKGVMTSTEFDEYEADARRRYAV
jgi:hypothetical protein